MFGFHKQTPANNSGQQAENAAASFLRTQGLKVLDRNYRCKGGEIDLICTSPENILIFVEVRHRRQTSFGTGADTVNSSKQKKIILAAKTYLQERYGNRPPACRFDVISTTGESYEIDWLQNAFGESA
ncbi:YraN family protein [Gynuella sp.]|uniref:YraN family protein n=1 Tax=Gynuella sp. TaxID=2969146 RepID=UPI003D0B5934